LIDEITGNQKIQLFGHNSNGYFTEIYINMLLPNKTRPDFTFGKIFQNS